MAAIYTLPRHHRADSPVTDSTITHFLTLQKLLDSFFGHSSTQRVVEGPPSVAKAESGLLSQHQCCCSAVIKTKDWCSFYRFRPSSSDL